MPGGLSDNLRGGARSEYLAQYLLSHLGIAVPVPRQEDIGADFICAPTFKEGQMLRVGSSFLVQIKATRSEPITYGGLDRYGNWKDYELNWLFGTDLPLFIGIADKEAMTLSLYATTPMRHAHFIYWPFGKIIMALDEDLASKPIEVLDDTFTPKEGIKCSGRTFRIPLGRPFVRLGVDSHKDQIHMAELRALVDMFAKNELENIALHRAGVHFGQLWYSPADRDHQTNAPFSSLKRAPFFAWNGTPEWHIQNQLDALFPILTTLIFNADAQQKYQLLRDLIPAYRAAENGKELSDEHRRAIEVRIKGASPTPPPPPHTQG